MCLHLYICNSVCGLMCIYMLVCVCVHAFSCVYVYLLLACSGPFDSALSTELALKQIVGHRSQLEALKREESTILHGLGFFKIEQPPFKNIQMLEKV